MDVDRKKIDSLARTGLYISIGTLVLTLVLAVVTVRLSHQAVESERQLDRAKDDFLALAAHQLRTPASGIRAILQALHSGDLGPLNDRQRHFLSRAIDSNAREISIIQELLDVAQSDAGRFLMNATEFDFCELVAQVVADQRPGIEQKGIKLEFHRPDRAVNITADHPKLVMAISNLLDNARKYTSEHGRIDVTVHTNTTHVSIEVADDGVGLEPADAARLFDRFQRGPALVATAVPGTGLGLYLARQVAELHKGTITVKSKKGHGSRFKIELPDGRSHAAA